MTSQLSSDRPAPAEGAAAPGASAKNGTARRAPAPGWFAAVMGTGILANAAATLPRGAGGLRPAATVIWVAAALLLLILTAGYVRQWALRMHAADPAAAQFLGAPPMALLTVGAGAVLLGGRVMGTRAALVVDWSLWSLGTAGGLATACAVPYLMITRHRFAPGAAFGGWLMPVVPPLVSAATGALLVPHAPAGEPRLALLLGCYALLGLGLVAVFLVLAMVYSSLVHHEAPAGAAVPTVWIGLGALGQAVTALGALATASRGVLPAPSARDAAALALLPGVGLWGFAVLWLALAAALTVREFRAGLPFAPTWWSFIFPLGALVTGTSALAARTGSQLFVWPGVFLYVLLAAAWAAVAWRSLAHAATHTRHGAARRPAR
ncbi:TDT family transporter [Streptomyces cocklensis]|uniref:C4-dicarboxylate transporter/malic acid transport protein n=1 Tax=Actinacidiphila cocklensis TaxID=887465 RepID=A0A9W4E4H7_9ACTN|nr:TDT family transporter [Actinacidiphila cocklensis]MDD1058872.1 TDT family transporter [Actinacidiphila cocklensis]CAG6399005.1 C4-dicarboxylate transporter/malic acid transport protein [Actinacidiphila cocklensis]